MCKCKWCGDLTAMDGTKECDRCYELRTRIDDDPELAKKILEGQPKILKSFETFTHEDVWKIRRFLCPGCGCKVDPISQMYMAIDSKQNKDFGAFTFPCPDKNCNLRFILKTHTYVVEIYNK